MNARIFTSAVLGCLLVVVMSSCGTTRKYPDNRPYPGEPYPTGRNPYPDGRYPDGRTYPTGRYPDGTPYPDSRYPDGRYPDRRSYPTSRNPAGKLPPGQAKKIYGQKSGKVFAPGQQNKDWKRGHDNDDDDHRGKKYSKKNKKYKD